MTVRPITLGTLPATTNGVRPARSNTVSVSVPPRPASMSNQTTLPLASLSATRASQPGTKTARSLSMLQPRTALLKRKPLELETLPVVVNIDHFNLSAAMANEDLARKGGTEKNTAPDASHERTEQRRAMLECMRTFSSQAYHTDGVGITEVGGFKPAPHLSSDVVKSWTADTPESKNLVIGFAGTRLNIGDLLRDVQSQNTERHFNPLNKELPSLGHIGQGWSSRWTQQATSAFDVNNQRLADALNDYAQQAKAENKALLVTVAGHSLGGVTSEVAGYDIAQLMKTLGLDSKTTVYAFNPPRLGTEEAGATYRLSLADGGNGAGRAGKNAPLALRQLSVNNDPVHTVPLGQHHPVWKENTETTRNATYHARPFTNNPLAAFGNHKINNWKKEIAQMPDFRVNQLFGD